MTTAGLDPLRTEIDAHLAAGQAAMALLAPLRDAGAKLCEVFATGGRLYTFGNGGSAADAQHLAAEFIGRFRRERRPLPAIALTTDPSVTSCIGNDFSFENMFARQVEALAGPEDMVAAFTTSGRSANVIAGLAAARAAGATTLLFGASDGGPAGPFADHRLLVEASGTARIQEVHLLLLHLLSEIVDSWAASSPGPKPRHQITR